MFKDPVPLNPQVHQHLRLASQPDYRFAQEQLITPFVSGEMWHIAREYVTVFSTQSNSLPLALLGTQAGVNVYVGGGSGQPAWWARYVPAHLRRYPFILAPRALPEGRAATPGEQGFTLCIDASAPQLNATQGRPLFHADGQPAELLQEVQKALIGLQRDLKITQTLVQQIEEADLLMTQHLLVQRDGQEPLALTGFRIVDQQKLRESPPEVLARLAQSGALDLVYAHIGSLSNLQDGLLAKKEAPGPASPATAATPGAAPGLQGLDIDALLAGSGTLKL